MGYVSSEAMGLDRVGLGTLYWFPTRSVEKCEKYISTIDTGAEANSNTELDVRLNSFLCDRVKQILMPSFVECVLYETQRKALQTNSRGADIPN